VSVDLLAVHDSNKIFANFATDGVRAMKNVADVPTTSQINRSRATGMATIMTIALLGVLYPVIGGFLQFKDHVLC